MTYTLIRPILVSNFEWLAYPGGLYSIGAQGDEFAFDNESPRHQTYLQDYKLGKPFSHESANI